MGKKVNGFINLGMTGYLAVVIGVLVVLLGIQTKRLENAKEEYAAFAAGVEQIGKLAQEKARKDELEAKLKKEKADNENHRRIAGLDATIKRLRDERAGGDLLPAPAPGAGGAERACFNRDVLERALGEFAEEATRIAEEGDHCRVDLDTAKVWAIN